MCKVCTEAVHCVSSPLHKPSEDEAPFKPPWNPSEGEAPFKPRSSLLEAPLKPPSTLKASSPLQATLKPLWSPLQAPPSEGEAPLKPSSTTDPRGASMQRCFVPNASRSVSVTSPAVERYSIVSSMSASTAGSSRKLSHESNLKGVASLLAELAAFGQRKRKLAMSQQPVGSSSESQWE